MLTQLNTKKLMNRCKNMLYNSERYTVDLRERSYRTIFSIFTIYVYLNLLNRYFYPPSILHQIVKKLIKCTWKKEPYRVQVINHLIIVKFFFPFWGVGWGRGCFLFIFHTFEVVVDFVLVILLWWNSSYIDSTDCADWSQISTLW